MGKKCVLWAKPVLVTLTIIFAVGLQWSDANLSAQSPDPLTLPRLAFADFTYWAAFGCLAPRRTVKTSRTADCIWRTTPPAIRCSSIAFTSKVAEVTIPAPVNSSDVNQMPFASYLQAFSDPSEGHLSDIGGGAVIGGLLVHGDRLYATGYDLLRRDEHAEGSRTSLTRQILSEPSFSRHVASVGNRQSRLRRRLYGQHPD